VWTKEFYAGWAQRYAALLWQAQTRALTAGAPDAEPAARPEGEREPAAAPAGPSGSGRAWQHAVAAVTPGDVAEAADIVRAAEGKARRVLAAIAAADRAALGGRRAAALGAGRG
jgi:hypothetical protein